MNFNSRFYQYIFAFSSLVFLLGELAFRLGRFIVSFFCN